MDSDLIIQPHSSLEFPGPLTRRPPPPPLAFPIPSVVGLWIFLEPHNKRIFLFQYIEGLKVIEGIVRRTGLHFQVVEG